MLPRQEAVPQRERRLDVDGHVLARVVTDIKRAQHQFGQFIRFGTVR